MTLVKPEIYFFRQKVGGLNNSPHAKVNKSTYIYADLPANMHVDMNGLSRPKMCLTTHNDIIETLHYAERDRKYMLRNAQTVLYSCSGWNPNRRNMSIVLTIKQT